MAGALWSIPLARAARWAALGVALLLGPGCGAWQRRGEVDEVERRLRAADLDYAARLDPARLDAAIAGYLEAQGLAPRDPRPMARLARAHYARGRAFPGRGDDDFGLAREFGLSCLLLDPAVAGRLSAEQGRLSPEVADGVGVGAVDCLTWASLGWSRWLQERGVAGAAIDRPSVVAMAERAVRLAPSYDRGRPHEALGVALSLSGGPDGPERLRAAQAFQRASTLAPTRLSLALELALLEIDLDARAAALAAVRDALFSGADPDELENQDARRRAAEALVEEPRQPEWWYDARPLGAAGVP